MNAFDIINQTLSTDGNDSPRCIDDDRWYTLGNDIHNYRHTLWMITLLTAISELSIDEIDRDMAYFYAKSTNAPFQSIMEAISTPEARHDSASDRQFLVIRKAYGSTIQSYMRSKIVHILKRIYCNTMGICKNSNTINRAAKIHILNPIAVEARSAEYIKGLINRLHDAVNRAGEPYSDAGPVQRDIDALLTAVRGYRFTDYMSSNKNKLSSIGSAHLTSDDMITLMRVAHIVAHSTSFNALRLVARIYLIVQLFTGYTNTNVPELDYAGLKKEVMSNDETDHYRIKFSLCRALSGVNPMVPLCFMDVFNTHITPSISGHVTVPTCPDSIAERLMFQILIA